jgi:coenzyme F420-reducing hydrogenase beta subunit
MLGLLIDDGSGPVASTEYIVPITSGQVNNIAAPVIGLEPTSPVTADLYTSVTPDCESMAKLPAKPRSTAGITEAAAAVMDEFRVDGVLVSIFESNFEEQPVINTANRIAEIRNKF